MQFIDLKKQYELIKNDVLIQINKVLDSGQYIMGEQVHKLEEELSLYTGAKYSIGVADGTKALLLALMAIDIKPQDEVIVPAFTFFASASMIALLGATPVFVDIDPKTYTVDPLSFEKAITSKTKAVITVSLFGQVSDHATINSIADAHNITVIEDAAQSFGATNNHIKSCNLTKIATTSFFPSKPLGAYGDGGACFTADEEIAIKIKKLRIHGQDYRYHHELLGLNARLDTIQAAILLAKLKVFDAEVKLRQEIGANYTQKLKNANCITPYIAEVNTHVYAQYSILVNNRDEFIKNLNNNNIPTAVHYPLPLHHQPSLMQYYDATVHQKLPYSEQISKQVVSVPMHPYLDENTQDYIVENVIKYAKL